MTEPKTWNQLQHHESQERNCPDQEPQRSLLNSRPFQLQDPVITLEQKSLPSHTANSDQERENFQMQLPTLATSSRSLFAGTSTFNGVIVAEATALAACTWKVYVNKAPFFSRKLWENDYYEHYTNKKFHQKQKNDTSWMLACVKLLSLRWATMRELTCR